jgi:hypothetical protein
MFADATAEGRRFMRPVMADQADLVEIPHTLRQVFNYKGT